MEGFAFDEDLFEEAIVKKRVVAVATSFKAKQCESEWFLKDGTDETDVEALRHKLDFLFYRKKFEDCLLVASSLLQKYTSSDLNYREILEVKTRCLVHTGRLRDAYEASTELTQIAPSACSWALHGSVSAHLCEWEGTVYRLYILAKHPNDLLLPL
eukprot:Colp12_sorted_trinity150504_noHs@19438